MRATQPANESERLEALRRYRILDTIPEQSFDDVALLASEICGTPIAAISVVDRDRQWFKSIIGLDVRETSRDSAFCAHAILQPNEVFIVEDATLDERFADNALVLEDPRIRFYAGMPLVTTDGLAVGTLCVIDRKARALQPSQRKALEVLGRAVVAQLELRRAVRSLERSHIELKRNKVNLEQNSQQQLDLKDQFISHVSHELRSPLAVVLQFITILVDGLAGELTAEQTEYLEISLRNAEQLKFMIGDLVEVTRAGTGKLTVENRPLNIGPVFEDVIGSSSVVAAERGITLSLDMEATMPDLVGDPARLRQILVNLVENALKFTAEGESVTVYAGLDGDDPDFVRISVADTGRGMSEADRVQIFDYLYQAATREESPRKGLGLGLYICRELVTRMGGRIWVESELGRGSRFSFTVPAFALDRLLAPVVTTANVARGSVALQVVDFFGSAAGYPTGTWPMALASARDIVRACTNPAMDVVLPHVGNGPTGESLVIVAMANEQGARALKERIDDQLARRPDIRATGYEWKIDTTVLAIPAMAEGSSMQSVASRIAAMLDSHLQETVLRRAA